MTLTKHILSICGLSLLSALAASGQVASHAPTVVSQASASGAARASKPVARVNGTVLTEADLLLEEYAIFPYARQHGGALPKEMEPQIRSGALKMIVFEELVYQEALREKRAVPAARMQQARADYSKQFATPDAFNAMLASEFHGSQKELDDKIRRSLLIESFLKSEVENKSKLSPDELKAYYDQNPARFNRPESYTFQSISILPPDKATADQLKDCRQRAENAFKQAKATKSSEEFGLLAEKVSDDDFRVMMGQHKPVLVDKLPPQVVKALAILKPGEISSMLQLDQAYTILLLNQHDPAGKIRFEDAKAPLEKELTQAKTNQLRSELDQKLRKNAKIEEM